MKFYSVATIVLGIAAIAGCAAQTGNDEGAVDQGRAAMDTPDGGQPPDPCGDDDDDDDDGPSCGEYGGRAYVAAASLFNGSPITVVDTGALPAAGGTLHAGLNGISVLGVVTGDIVAANVEGSSGSTASNATVAGLKVDLGGLDLGDLSLGGLDLGNILGGGGGGLLGGGGGLLGGLIGGIGNGVGLGATLENILGALSIQADAVTADASASCGTSSGQSTIANLTLNGGALVVSGAPNQVIDLLPGNILGLDAKIIVNEQESTSAANKTGMKVNALHVKVALGQAKLADVVVSSADASYVCCPK